MARLEVADILRARGAVWREHHHGHISVGQYKVMSAIERCRSASLGGHVLHCRACGHDQIAYNSCRNRHCPKCQASAARRWMAARQAELLPVDYYHVVFTLPAAVAALAYQNKAVVYAILFRTAAQTLLTIGADPKRLGCLLLEQLKAAYEQGELQCHGDLDHLADAAAFADWLKPLRQVEWVVYSKRPFAGPEAVLSYLSRYTHRVAISNSRLLRFDNQGVTFKWKDYRAKGKARYKTMTLATEEFIRRFLLHVLPTGFHRIRHYGLFANTCRQANLSRARALLDATPSPEGGDAAGAEYDSASSTAVPEDTYLCPDCGAPMVVAEVFAGMPWSRAPPGRNRIE